MSKDLTALLTEHKIVAIFRGLTGESADRAAAALVEGGIKFIEATMNTEGVTAIIAKWREQLPAAYIGAGTVLNLAMAKEAVSAGAQYLISPNLDEAVIAYGSEQGVDVWPGVMTPTEIVKAWNAGAKLVKLFPMGTLGLGYLKEIRAPLNHIPIMASGGVDLSNIAEYLQAGASAVGMGSKLLNPELLRSGNFEQLTETARQYRAAAGVTS